MLQVQSLIYNSSWPNSTPLLAIPFPSLCAANTLVNIRWNPLKCINLADHKLPPAQKLMMSSDSIWDLQQRGFCFAIIHLPDISIDVSEKHLYVLPSLFYFYKNFMKCLPLPNVEFGVISINSFLSPWRWELCFCINSAVLCLHRSYSFCTTHPFQMKSIFPAPKASSKYFRTSCIILKSGIQTDSISRFPIKSGAFVVIHWAILHGGGTSFVVLKHPSKSLAHSYVMTCKVGSFPGTGRERDYSLGRRQLEVA